MDDAKRTVLVAALSAYAELLAKNTAQLALEQGKGKGKASDDDVDLAVEIHNEINLCSELANTITGATSSGDITQSVKDAAGASNPPKDGHVLWEELEKVLEQALLRSPSQIGNNLWTDCFLGLVSLDSCPQSAEQTELL